MRCPGLFFCLLISFPSGLLPGQDADTILLKSDARKFALVSQIENPKEAGSFLHLLQTSEPASRCNLAHRFLAEYPQSWLLAQVYDIAARCAIDLGQYQQALDDGRFSLRLMPENPLLLVMLANVESQQEFFPRAIEESSDALEYLDATERPPNMTETEWTALRPRAKASAYFARARAQAGRALAATPHNSQQLSLALQDLNRSAAWNPEDPEVFYLRGIVELQLNTSQEAASDLAFVSQTSNPMQEKAEKILSLLSKDTRLQHFLAQIPPRKIDASLRSEHAPDSTPTRYSGYAGPESCQTCHIKEYTAWRKTGMARMLQPYRPENIIGDFSPGTEYHDDNGDAIRMGIAGRPYFELLAQSQWQRFYVDYTIGSKWQQGYATKLFDGRMQVLPIEYNLLHKKWVNYWKMIDPPGSPRAIIRDFPKLTAATNYQQNCAICHTSQLKLDSTQADPMQHASYLQPGIDCEMCHGPAAQHARQKAKAIADHGEPAAAAPFDFRKATNRDGVRVCAQCHRQSAIREIGPAGEMNYSVTGNFVPSAWLRSYDAFSRKAFFKDGRFRETTFIVEAFTRSACYRRGTAQCATCHSPHQPDFEHNPTSLKHVANPNEMCLPCHSEYRNRSAQHTHHQAGTEASQCISCHMPKIVNAVLFKVRSHQIETPTADLTERFGQEQSPNVCLTCHEERNAAWAAEQLTQWRR